MKKILLRFVFFLPLAVLMLWDSILPLDYFTRRSWEAVCVMRPSAVLKGFFYPRVHLEKEESVSDLRGQSDRRDLRRVVWDTDRYGYRKKEPPIYSPEIVVIGDSNMAGSGISQEHLFSEVLETHLQKGVYPLAPAGFDAVFSAPYFRAHPPKVVLLSYIERNLTVMGRSETSAWQRLLSRFPVLGKVSEKSTEMLLSQPALLQAGIFIDRFFYKKTLPQSLKAKLRRKWMSCFDKSERFKKNPGPREMQFFQGDSANADVSPQVLEATVQTVLSYQEACRVRGMRFIFMPIPNKENIYYDLLPRKTPPVFLRKLLTRLRSEGVETLDLQTVFEDYRKAHPDQYLYDFDDSHWNARGAAAAAVKTAAVLRSPPS